MENFYNCKLLNDLDIISQQLNKTFLNINNRVSKMIFKDTGTHSKTKKLLLMM